MIENTTAEPKQHYTPRGTLLALGIKMEQKGIFAPIREQVKIKQKIVKDSQSDKLLDSLISILAGGQGLVEVNKRVGSDPALQYAFGRSRCAEQSVISETLNASTQANVKQMESAMKEIYRLHSQGYQHDYGADWQLWDVDLTGQPCGKKAEFATKGYFAGRRNRRGRQLGRVLASWYEEVIVDRVYEGRTTLPTALQELVTAAADVCELDEPRRTRTIVRIDGHGGSQDDVNWLLDQGYHIHTKEYSSKRANKLAEQVTQWHDDPTIPGRQIGWVDTPTPEYVCPVRRIAVRTRKKNGHWGVGVLISTLSFTTVTYLAGLPADRKPTPLDILLAYVQFYDQRGGGVETAFRQDKQALGITKRNKKSFTAQAIITQLNALAHNLIIWFRQWLAEYCHSLWKLGLMRMIRDIFHANASVTVDRFNSILDITLTQFDPFAVQIFDALQQLLLSAQVDVNLGET